MKKEPMTIRIDLLLKMALTEISIKEKYKNVNDLIANILKESIAQKQKDGQLSEQLLAIDEKISVIYEAVKIMATKQMRGLGSKNHPRIISSPKLDYTVAPSIYRRYQNSIIGYFAVIFCISLWTAQHFLFWELDFFKTIFFALKKNNDLDLSFMFYFKSAICFGSSAFLAHYITKLMTPPVNRVEVTAGNFLDDDELVLENIAKDFKSLGQSDSICLMRKGEMDYNTFPAKPIKADIFLPNQTLELSTFIRGNAGSGKSVYTNRVLKEKIMAGQKVILHNIKGDEFKMLNGFCDFYLIEPWNRKGGYAINFLQLLAWEREEDRDAYTRLFAKSFCGKSSKGDAFFDGSALEVIFAVTKKVVEDNLIIENGRYVCTASLGDIVSLWVSFQASTEDKEIDLTNPQSMKEALNNKIESLEKIKKILIEKNPTQADLIDSNNAKTSLCILATCTKTIKKFEVLSRFWGKREKTKSLDLVKWLNNPKDRKVLMLSNSNLYVAEAEAYISAVVNLMTMFVINPEYEPKTEVNFILDEFVQLSSIDLKQFMKLPDVGRGKLIRVYCVAQRSSQIKEIFDMDPASFAGAFQNYVWARMATDDFSVINAELGKQDTTIYKSSSNNNAQGQSSGSSTEEKQKDVINPADIQKELGPVEQNGKFLAVRILLNFNKFKRISVVTFPPVDFPKKKQGYKFKSTAGNSPALPSEQPTSSPLEPELLLPPLHEEATTHTVIAGESVDQVQIQEEDPLASAVTDIASHALLPEPISAVMQLAEMFDDLESKTKNTNVIQTEVIQSETEDQKKELLKALFNKNKKEIEK